MRVRMTGLLALIFVGGAFAQAETNGAFLIQRGVAANKFRPDAEGVLFQHGDVAVLKRLGVKDSSFKDIYWVNFDGLLKVEEEFKPFGDVLHFEPGLFALMRIADASKVFNLSASLHEQGMACGALINLKGDIVKSLPKVGPVPVLPVSTKVALVEDVQQLIKGENIEATIDTLSAIHTRHHTSATGKTIADKVIEMYKPLAEGRNDVEFTTFDHGSRTPQPSMVIRIKGTTLPDEIVILGSHIDSISYGGIGGRSPGADDNASGTATNLEIFRALMAKGFRPQRTIEIHGYAAEEIGLVGSQDMAAKYKQQGKNVIAMVQHDMNIFCSSGPDKIWFVSNNTSSDLNGQLESLLKLYQTVEYGKAPLGGGNSDHYSWTRNGYHAAFPFENPRDYNSHIHTPDDTTANADRFNQAAEFAKLGAAYTVHFAGM